MLDRTVKNKNLTRLVSTPLTSRKLMFPLKKLKIKSEKHKSEINFSEKPKVNFNLHNCNFHAFK